MKAWSCRCFPAPTAASQSDRRPAPDWIYMKKEFECLLCAVAPGPDVPITSGFDTLRRPHGPGIAQLTLPSLFGQTARHTNAHINHPVRWAEPRARR
jgi:hypothetical protein